MRATTVMCKFYRTCFKFYCMSYFTCDRSFASRPSRRAVGSMRRCESHHVDSTPSLGVYYFLSLTVCLSRCSFKLLLLFCFSMESSHFWPPVLHVALYKTVFFGFHRAKLRVVRYCHGKLSVCPSVCPSVTLRYRDHIGWNSAKIISRLISLIISLSADPNMTDLLQREHPQILAGI